MLADGSLIHDRYEIKRLLDENDFGAFYLAYDQQAGHPVALKAIKRSTPDLESQFDATVIALAGIHHPVVPEYVDDFSHNDACIYVCEHKSDDSLEDWRERSSGGKLSLRAATIAILQILEALQKMYAHEPPLTHGNIRPKNIFVSPEGHVTLTNFSMVRPSNAQPEASSNGIAPATYLAFEQQPTTAIPHDDLHSVGVTLYTLITGATPSSTSEQGILSDLHALRPDVSPQLASLILDLLKPGYKTDIVAINAATDTLRDVLEPKVCDHCGFENPVTAKWCEQCGRTLPVMDQATALVEALRQHVRAAPPTSVAGGVVSLPATVPDKRAKDDRKRPLRWIVWGIVAVIVSLLSCIGVVAAARNGFFAHPAVTASPRTVTAIPTPNPQVAEGGTGAIGSTATAIATDAPQITIVPIVTSEQATSPSEVDLQASQTAQSVSATTEANEAALGLISASQTSEAAIAQTRDAQVVQASEVATATPLPPTDTPAPPPKPKPPAPTPTPIRRLRFTLLNNNDAPGCISINISRINTQGWHFSIDGIKKNIVGGRFDSSGNARLCGLGPEQEVTLTVFDKAGRSVLGGRGIPTRGRAIMQAVWR